MRRLGEVSRELLQVARLAGKIKLPPHDSAKLCHGRQRPIRLQFRKLFSQLGEAAQDIEIHLHPPANARVLHLHHHVVARVQPRAVRLPNRGRGQRRRVKISKQRFERLLKLRLDRLAHYLRLVARHTSLQLLQFLRERHSDLVGSRTENLPQLDERGPQLFDRHPNSRFAIQMGELLAVAVLQKTLHQRQIEAANPSPPTRTCSES